MNNSGIQIAPRRNKTNRQKCAIAIFSASQAALKALESAKLHLKLEARITLTWVSEYTCHQRNENSSNRLNYQTKKLKLALSIEGLQTQIFERNKNMNTVGITEKANMQILNVRTTARLT